RAAHPTDATSDPDRRGDALRARERLRRRVPGPGAAQGQVGPGRGLRDPGVGVLTARTPAAKAGYARQMAQPSIEVILTRELSSSLPPPGSLAAPEGHPLS